MRIVRTDDPAALDAVAQTLNAGGVAVIPTDTVYGLAARPDFPAAVERLYTIKNRDARKPIALLAADAAAVAAFGHTAPEPCAKLWPGAFTAVLPPNPAAPGAAKEGFRVPDHEWTRALLRKCGGVLRATSANLSGGRPATDAPQALADVGLSADIIADGGVAPVGVPSTVAEFFTDGTWRILRKGAVDMAQAPIQGQAAQRAALEKVAATLGGIIGRAALNLQPGDTKDTIEGWDSIAQIQLAAELQQQCGRKFTSAELANWRTAGDIAASLAGATNA